MFCLWVNCSIAQLCSFKFTVRNCKKITRHQILYSFFYDQEEKTDKEKPEVEEKKFDGSGPDHELVEILGKQKVVHLCTYC